MQSKFEADSRRLDVRARPMKIIWTGLVLSVGMYFALAFFIGKPDSEDPQSRTITFALTAVAVLLVLVSFAIKQKFYAQAEQKQSLALIQTGLIIALAMCEAAALLGLLDAMITGNRYYAITFFVALIGMVVHFPRRSQLAAASYRGAGNQTQGS